MTPTETWQAIEKLENKIFELELKIQELESSLSQALSKLDIYNPYNY